MISVSSARLRAGISRHLCVIALVVGSATLGACATAGAAGGRTASTTGPAGVVIENNSWSRVTVYVATPSGQRVRLGDVEGFSRVTFPARRVNLLAGGGGTFLIARPLAGMAFRSETFLPPSNGLVVWTIQNQSAHSYISMRG
jgi:hypothetical protein